MPKPKPKATYVKFILENCFQSLRTTYSFACRPAGKEQSYKPAAGKKPTAGAKPSAGTKPAANPADGAKFAAKRTVAVAQRAGMAARNLATAEPPQESDEEEKEEEEKEEEEDEDDVDDGAAMLNLDETVCIILRCTVALFNTIVLYCRRSKVLLWQLLIL